RISPPEYSPMLYSASPHSESPGSVCEVVSEKISPEKSNSHRHAIEALELSCTMVGISFRIFSAFVMRWSWKSSHGDEYSTVYCASSWRLDSYSPTWPSKPNSKSPFCRTQTDVGMVV